MPQPTSVNNKNNKGLHMVSIDVILTSIITALVTVLLKPLKDFVHSENEERCSYELPYTSDQKRVQNKIIVTKKFGKVTHISCDHWKTIQKVRYKTAEFMHCPFGAFLSDVTQGPHYECLFTKTIYIDKVELRAKLLRRSIVLIFLLIALLICL